MNDTLQDAYTSRTANLKWLAETYFSDPSRRLDLKKGEALLREGERNERLFMVLSGVLRGFARDVQGNPFETFKARKQAFVGGPSYFSKTYVSISTVIAEEDSTVAFIDSSQEAVFDGKTSSLAEQFMPHMVAELTHRQQRVHKIALENEQALRALIHSEKMVSMGKIAAWISHELNNAVAVVKRNCDWLGPNLASLFQAMEGIPYSVFERGLGEGRKLSSREARKRSKEIRARFKLNDLSAQRLSQTGLTDEELKPYSSSLTEKAAELAHFWEIGATLNDMKSASEHAIHVVKSVRELGAQNSERAAGLFIDECVREAVTLLASPLRKVNLELELNAPPPIVGNKGEIVQILINLIQNACDSLAASSTVEPTLRMATRGIDHGVVIQISDNGPGIPPQILPRIFEPHLSTKTQNQTSGLGLGLMIVDRIVDSYGGRIAVDSRPGETVFTLRIPRGGEHG